MSFKPYPAYKDSSVGWLGDVPSHWEMKRIRVVAELNPSKSEISDLDRETEVSFLPMESIGDDGSLSLERTRPIGEVETGYTYFRDGDVTLAKITPCFENGKGALMRGLQLGIGFGTTELVVARPKAGQVTSEYLNWIFRSPYFRKNGEGSMYGAGGQKRVPDDFVRNFALAFPPLTEQTAIASFLVRETSKIDALIAEQQHLIELLAEKRQSVISHAVTKGLNPDVPMKDSGVEWLGAVPRHWRVKRIGSLFREIIEEGSEGLPILSVSIHDGVSDKELNDQELDRKVTRSEDRSKYKRVTAGDLVYNMMRAWQGGFGTVTVEGMVSPAYVIARPMADLATQYIEHVLRTQNAVEEMRRHSRGVTDFRLRLYWDEFKSIHVPVPPNDEQTAILGDIAAATQKYKALADEAEAAIRLLQERRSALISTVVTGKFDVRDSAEKAAA